MESYVVVCKGIDIEYLSFKPHSRDSSKQIDEPNFLGK